jgi:hypothetical protein
MKNGKNKKLTKTRRATLLAQLAAAAPLLARLSGLEARLNTAVDDAEQRILELEVNTRFDAIETSIAKTLKKVSVPDTVKPTIERPKQAAERQLYLVAEYMESCGDLLPFRNYVVQAETAESAIKLVKDKYDFGYSKKEYFVSSHHGDIVKCDGQPPKLPKTFVPHKSPEDRVPAGWDMVE